MGMDDGGEAAACVEVGLWYAADGKSAASWHRLVMRFDVRTGTAAAAMKFDEYERRIELFDYHSSMARFLALHHRV
ncbi:hypothetical protein E2562_020108 [Oryza meyeriana var. granulata]|uniref:Uncharacterized protein n=1 Tax=Oryza meyeriana var. granulata TaxID=110450 RepID=A0A6G1EBI1_9ORYZ|nr:hypothetical protein E2562_020108 [Oryza meyeriana var. granulata]